MMFITNVLFFGYLHPSWCSYPVEPVNPMADCWGLFRGYVEKQGVEYCKKCECYNEVKND